MAEVLASSRLPEDKGATKMSDKDTYRGIAASYIADDRHWGSDLDVIKSAMDELMNSLSHPIRYADFGCGTGFHIAAIKRWYPNTRVTGVDSSACMLNRARKELGLLWLTRRVELVHADVRHAMIGHFDMISSLNNGFGNMYARDAFPATLRSEVLCKMRAIMPSGGQIVMSVYHLNKLDANRYGRNIHVLPQSDLHSGDLFLRYNSERGTFDNYYSHWFTREELTSLLEQNGFEVELLEERMARLVVMARAV